MTAPAVVLRDVTTILDDVPVLLRLGLDLRAGSVTVLMGPSGAGKSTLVRHLAGLLQPDAGRVEIGGQDVFAARPDELRRIRRGMSVLLGGSSLFDTSLFASETGFENVRHGFTGRDVAPERQDHLVALALRELGLERWAAMLPAQMPAHARRRMALARALVAEAPLVVLDEIETGLDAATAPHVVAALRDLHARTGATILLTTHDLALARELGDELLVLCHGRIVARGPAAELLRGVETGDDFDRRFRVSDFLGPPRLEDALRAVEDRPRPRTFEIDERLLMFAAAAFVLVTTVVALYLAGPFRR